MDIKYIKSVMKENNITQIQLSEMSNIPIQTLRKIFAGYTPNPRIDTVQAIERALGITNEQTNIDISPKKQQLLEILSKIDDSYADDILAMIKIYLSKDK